MKVKEMTAGSALPTRFHVRASVAIVIVLCAAIALYLVMRFTSNSPVTYSGDVENFKYGSTGGEINSGIPYSVWKALPGIFSEYLPGKYPAGQEYAAFGFLYEDGRDLPVGVSRRRVQGIDRVFFNCAICHVGSVRDTPSTPPRHVPGMPSNTVDLRGFYQFLFNAALDEKFTPPIVLAEIKRQGIHEDLINRLILRYYAVGAMQASLVARYSRLRTILTEPEFGPGRIDTFSPAKVLLNFRMDKAPESEKIGTTDLPSVWYQRQREGMRLHWDGNNDLVMERNRSAAFGTGAYPPTLDRAYLDRIRAYLEDLHPINYPYPIDSALAARGEKIYAAMCANCHGRNGKDFHAGEGHLGTVIPIEDIKTDRSRLDSYTYELAVNQSLLYAGYGDERFSHFRKTYGYAAMPLDGLWLRAPYLHNGSVPNLHSLLEPAKSRPATFYRGDDVFDPESVGFTCTVPERYGHKFFFFDTKVTGNGNQGHEGKVYGTELPLPDKKALIEYLKTF